MIFDIFKMIGGLSLFIFGMKVTTDGLRTAAGSALRTVLSRSAANPRRGLVTGTLLGFLTHSGTATIMTIGFVNAGLLPLAASLAPIYGANIGTALAMQLFSLNITPFSWVAIAIGYLMYATLRKPRLKQSGMALIGFGLIFLGMDTVSAALMPYRESMAPWLAQIRGDTFMMRLAGVGIASLISALLTSSGAMIGICFSLINAGLMTTFDDYFPLVAGARIGTCIVTLIASISMNNEARRSAISHLLFNIFNVIFALSLYPLFKALTEWSDPSPLRQAANLHVIMALAAALPLLPLSEPIARLLRRLVSPGTPLPEPSYLQPELVSTPERALLATVMEIRRMSKVCSRNMTLNGEIMLHYRTTLHRMLSANEEIINEIRESVGDYLDQVTGYSLSPRQTIFVQHLDRCMKDIERVGDYQDALAETTALRRSRPAEIPEEIFSTWFNLFVTARRVLLTLENSLNPESSDTFNTRSQRLLEARDNFSRQSAAARALFTAAARERTISGTAAYYLYRYQADLDRMLGHVRSIAVALGQPEFQIRPTKLDQQVGQLQTKQGNQSITPESYRDHLYCE